MFALNIENAVTIKGVQLWERENVPVLFPRVHGVHFKLSSSGGTDLGCIHTLRHKRTHTTTQMAAVIFLCTGTNSKLHTLVQKYFSHSLTHSGVRRVDWCTATGLDWAGLIHLVFHMSDCITAVRNISLSLLLVSVSLSLITSTSTASCRLIHASTQPVSHPANQQTSNWQPSTHPPVNIMAASSQGINMKTLLENS